MSFIHKVVKRLVAIYEAKEDSLIRSQISVGNNVEIKKPFLISPSKDICVGSNSVVLDGARLQVFSNIGKKDAKLQIGSNCYICYRFCALASDDIVIGNDVLMASDILLVTHNHGIDPISDIPYMDQPLETKPISIGDGCWLGDKVIVLPGVTIGEKSIIGAGSVVTKDIPPYSIAVGNPAKVIKQYDFQEKEWKKVEIK